MHYAVCKLVSILYIVICNTVRLIYRKSYVTGRYFYGALWFLVTQTNITKFFSAKHDFHGGSGLKFSWLGPGLAAIFVAAAA